MRAPEILPCTSAKAGAPGTARSRASRVRSPINWPSSLRAMSCRAASSPPSSGPPRPRRKVPNGASGTLVRARRLTCPVGVPDAQSASPPSSMASVPFQRMCPWRLAPVRPLLPASRSKATSRSGPRSARPPAMWRCSGRSGSSGGGPSGVGSEGGKAGHPNPGSAFMRTTGCSSLTTSGSLPSARPSSPVSTLPVGTTSHGSLAPGFLRERSSMRRSENQPPLRESSPTSEPVASASASFTRPAPKSDTTMAGAAAISSTSRPTTISRRRRHRAGCAVFVLSFMTPRTGPSPRSCRW